MGSQLPKVSDGILALCSPNTTPGPACTLLPHTLLPCASCRQVDQHQVRGSGQDLWVWWHLCHKLSQLSHQSLAHLHLTPPDFMPTDPTPMFAPLPHLLGTHRHSHRQIHIRGHTQGNRHSTFQELLPVGTKGHLVMWSEGGRTGKLLCPYPDWSPLL